MEESKLVELARSGDKHAMAALVRNYEQTIFNFAFKVCRNKDRAENTMQETFLSMIRNLHQFDMKSKLSTWLYTIVSNHCLMQARSQRKHNFTSLDDDENPVSDIVVTDWDINPAQITENNELKQILDETISQLAPEYRLVFLLRDVEGLSTEETAKVMDLSVPAVKSRLHRARAFLRDGLNREFQHEK